MSFLFVAFRRPPGGFRSNWPRDWRSFESVSVLARAPWSLPEAMSNWAFKRRIPVLRPKGIIGRRERAAGGRSRTGIVLKRKSANSATTCALPAARLADFSPRRPSASISFIAISRRVAWRTPSAAGRMSTTRNHCSYVCLQAPSSNWKSRLGGGQLERTTHPANSMAHTIDVDVGGRCLKCGLNCRGFGPHAWR